MKISEIREMSKDEVLNKINLSEMDLAKLKFKNALKQLENPMSIRELRKNIARMKTILVEK